MSKAVGASLAAGALAFLIAMSVLVVGGEDLVGAAHDDRPNVIVIMADDQFTTTVKYMPYVSSRSDWAQFSNAIVNTSLCCPSRATFLTGRTSTHTGIRNNSATEKFKGTSTLADWLDASGYQTGFVGKYLNKFPWDAGKRYIPAGWDYWAGYTGRQPYFDYDLNENGTLVRYRGADDYSTDVLADRAVDFIDQVSAKEPFFEFLSFNSPHSPWTPPERYAEADVEEIPESDAFLESDISDKPAWLRDDVTTLSRRKLRLHRVKHNRGLLALDDAVEQVFDALEARGLLKNTIVVYTSDHGVSMGEHRYNHKTCAYEVCSRVPLLVRGPGVVPGRIPGIVGNIDTAPTITDYAGIETGETVDGRSYRPLLERRRSSLHEGILLRRAQGKRDRFYWGLRTERWKYVHYTFTGERELYDLKHDPGELLNLISTDRRRWERRADGLARRLRAIRRTKPQIR